MSILYSKMTAIGKIRRQRYMILKVNTKYQICPFVKDYRIIEAFVKTTFPIYFSETRKTKGVSVKDY